jgi:energy-coupling factor transport system ATP-binding protein
MLLKNLGYTYDPKSPMAYRALSDVDLSVNKGEVLGIIGHTGSGKSTLLRLLAGQFKATEGELELGEAIRDIRGNIKRGAVGLVLQYPEDQLFEENIFDDVAYGPRQLGHAETSIRNAVEDSLRFLGVDLTDIDTRSPFELSGGQKRKVAIAGILAMQPEILILDEPTSGLDPMSKWKFLKMLKELNQQGRTIILVSHDLEAILDVSDRVVVLNNGRIEMSGRPVDVFPQVEELRELRIGTFIMSEFLHELQKAGVKTEKTALTIDEFEKTIQKLEML